MYQCIRLHKSSLVILIFICARLSYSCPLQKLVYVTENFPPYNFMVEGELKGISLDTLIAASLIVDCPVQRSFIRVLPWPRAYKMAIENQNTVIHSIVRTKSRESLFKWAGPITKGRVALIARKTRNISITNLNKLSSFLVGVVRNDIGHKDALKLGFKESNFRFANNAENLAQMLAVGRIDLWSYGDITANWVFRKLGYEIDSFEVINVLRYTQGYFAFNKHIDDEAITLLQQGIDKLKNSPGRYGKSLLEEIISNYQ